MTGTTTTGTTTPDINTLPTATGNITFGQGVTDSGSKSTSTSRSSSQSGIEQWYQNYEKDLLAKAQAEAAKGYTPYTGQRQAGFTPDQLGAMEMIRQAVENPAYEQYVQQWAPTLATAPGMMAQGAGLLGQYAQYSPEMYNQMYAQYDPALQGLKAEAQRVGSQDFTNTTLADLNRKFAGSGGWGGSRNQILGADAAARAQAEIAGKQAGIEMQGRTNAAQDYLNWARQGTSAAQGLIGAGKDIIGGAQSAFNYGTGLQNAIGADASALAAVGKQQQEFNQGGLDIAYQDFLKKQQFPWEQINAYTNVLKSAPAPQFSNSSSTSSNVTDQYSTGSNYNVGLTMPSGTALSASDLATFAKGITAGAKLVNGAPDTTSTTAGANPATLAG